MLTRVWKREWQKLFPKLNIDWKIIVNTFNVYFGEAFKSSRAVEAEADQDEEEMQDEVKEEIKEEVVDLLEPPALQEKAPKTVQSKC